MHDLLPALLAELMGDLLDSHSLVEVPTMVDLSEAPLPVQVCVSMVSLGESNRDGGVNPCLAAPATFARTCPISRAGFG